TPYALLPFRLRQLPRAALFPYTTLFRSRLAWHPAHSGPGWSSCRLTRDPARPESRSPGSVVSVVVLAQPGQPGAAVGGADAAPDLVDDAAAGQVGGEQAGAFDAAGAAGAVRDDDGAVQAEQHRAAVALAVQPVAELAQRLALQQGAGLGHPAGGERAAHLVEGEPDRALHRLQRHVPGEAVGDHHVHVAGEQVVAL